MGRDSKPVDPMHNDPREFIRVTKPGGYIGLNESCWVKSPVPEQVVQVLAIPLLRGGQLETFEVMRELLTTSGLRDVAATRHSLTARGDLFDRARWFGARGLLTNLYHIITFALSGSANRKAIGKFLSMQRQVAPELYDYYGYGIFVGSK